MARVSGKAEEMDPAAKDFIYRKRLNLTHVENKNIFSY